MSSGTDLIELMGWEPREDASRLSWTSAEERLGFTFPSDYKELMSTFGSGVFDLLVGVLCPARQEDDFISEMNRILEYARGNEPLPHRLYPDPDGLIPWAECGDAWTLFWRTDRGGPDQWTIVYCDAEFAEWGEYDGSATTFLLGLLTGKIDTKFADWEPVDNPEFGPYRGH
jgi:hypothetical protein